jgi:hypothetical protein
MHDRSRQRRLSMIDVTRRADIHVRLIPLEPFFSHLFPFLLKRTALRAVLWRFALLPASAGNVAARPHADSAAWVPNLVHCTSDSALALCASILVHRTKRSAPFT